MISHYEYLRDIVAAAEEVGAYVVSFGPADAMTAGFRVTLEWPGQARARITVEDILPAQAIRRLPNYAISEEVPS